MRAACAGGVTACVVLVLALTATQAPAAPLPQARQTFHSPDPGPPALPGTLLVTARSPGRAASLARQLDGGLAGVGGPVAATRLGRRVLAVHVPPGQEAATGRTLAGLPGVAAVERERTMGLQRIPDDPLYANQWAHGRTGAATAWEQSTGHGARIAVIDSGILGTHPDLTANIVEPQVSTVGGEAVARGIGVDNDPCEVGHGTFVAGLAAAIGDNGEGVAGVAWDVSLVDVSALSPAVGCDGLPDSAILAGLEYAVHNPLGPVDVVNLSFGRVAERCPAAYQAAIDEAREAGVVVVAAAGNGEADPDSAGRAMIPASCDGVVSVGATTREDVRAGYSSTNPFVDLVAPGGDRSDDLDGYVISTSRGASGYGREAGTSHAAPYVSGAAALVRAVAPSLDADQVESVLERSATDIGRPGRDNGTGWGLVRLDAALQLAGAGDVPPAEPDPAFAVDDTVQPWSPPEVIRLAAAGTTTIPVNQAVAVSRVVFGADEALHAVLAREDDFADALAGSALGAGLGPLLFTASDRALADATRRELERALPPGAVVYLLGGSAALPSTLERELEAMGLRPVRLSGPSREHTAAAVAAEVDRLALRALGGVLLARSDQWPDAVAGGSMAAWFGMPVLLTPPSSLHPAAAEMLAALSPDRIYALGGTAALAEDVLESAGDAAGVARPERVRLAGAGRAETTVAIATEMERLLRAQGDGAPGGVLVVNLRKGDAFTHALSASAVSGATAAVMVAVEGTNGSALPTAVRDYVQGFGVDGFLMGGRDVITDAVGDDLEKLLRG